MRVPLERARERLLREILPGVGAACDLCCGTGITAMALAQKGIRTYAVDLSPLMCRTTREKARRAGLRVRVIQGDMRGFRLPEAVDLITCEFDALNHVPDKTDLPKVAAAVARALRPGGHFFFDVNNARGFERYWTTPFWLEKPGVVVVMRNGHSRGAERAWSDVEWFVREGRLWRRYGERVEEVCWDANEIRRTLEAAGFDRVQARDAAPFFKGDPYIKPGCRTFYLARKGPL